MYTILSLKKIIESWKFMKIVMFTILFVLLFVNLSCSLGNIENFHNSTDNILCRNCGSHLLTSDKIIAKVTPYAEYSFNDTLFNRNEILVQVLHQNIFFRVPVITSSHSSCVAPGEWEDDELWFAGYAWKPCFCSECGMLIGWVFEHDSPKIVPAHDKFFGLILPNLISENSNYYFCYRYKFTHSIPGQFIINMGDSELSAEDKDFLAKCEEEFKDRFTENDEEFMKVFNREPSTPPILEKKWKPFHPGRRNDRRNNRYNPYHRGQNNSNQEHRDFRYNDRSHEPHRSRYSNY